MRWAIASKEMIPEPSSLAPGAYEAMMSSDDHNTADIISLTRGKPNDPRES